MVGKLLLQGVNLIREANASLCYAWLRLEKAGMAWDVRGVNTALPEGRGCVARLVAHVWSLWCGVPRHGARKRGRRDAARFLVKSVGEAGMPCAGGQHMPLVSETSQTPRARWVCAVLASCTLSRVICLGLMNGKKPGLSCYADQDAGILKSRTNPLSAFGKSATGI